MSNILNIYNNLKSKVGLSPAVNPIFGLVSNLNKKKFQIANWTEFFILNFFNLNYQKKSNTTRPL